MQGEEDRHAGLLQRVEAGLDLADVRPEGFSGDIAVWRTTAFTGPEHGEVHAGREMLAS